MDNADCEDVVVMTTKWPIGAVNTQYPGLRDMEPLDYNGSYLRVISLEVPKQALSSFVMGLYQYPTVKTYTLHGYNLHFLLKDNNIVQES